MRCEMLHSVIRHGVHGPKRNARAAPRGDVFLDEWPPPEPPRPLIKSQAKETDYRSTRDLPEPPRPLIRKIKVRGMQAELVDASR